MKGSWRGAGVLLCGVAFATIANAQTFKTVFSFDSTDGAQPTSLVQGFDGNLYGTTWAGGSKGRGTIFKTNTAGALSTIYNFCSLTSCNDGMEPNALMQAADGNLYGTTFYGAAGGWGSVFEVTSSGALTTLHSFGQIDGAYPEGGLVQGTDGNFYGTTNGGGTSHAGTVYKITSSGALTSLHSFCAKVNTGCKDGASPYGGVVQAGNGYFYGTTTSGGGGTAPGTIFRITATGALTTLYNFSAQDGDFAGGLLQSSSGMLYGTMAMGGSGSNCAESCGTIFKASPAGFETVYSFCSLSNCADGNDPRSLIQATDGNIYGVTIQGGIQNAQNCSIGCGTIFKMSPEGALTTLYSFCAQTNCTDGFSPATLMQATDGKLYGTTQFGGTCTFDCGTVFSLDLGLAPFVETNPTSGKVGWQITIFGGNLKGTTAISFNGTPATFTVVSPTKISATVPSGATSGTVQVVTPSGTFSSNVAFRVMP